jgi:hypothetical protein
MQQRRAGCISDPLDDCVASTARGGLSLLTRSFPMAGKVLSSRGLPAPGAED